MTDEDTRTPAPLVGREVELRQLEEVLQRALRSGQPHAVTLVGGPGLGKSRLAREFALRASESGSGRPIRHYQGTAHDGKAAFGIVQRLLRARFGIADGDDAERAATKVRNAVSATLGDPRVSEFLHFLGAFLDIRVPGSPLVEALEEDPSQPAMVSRAVLRRFLEVDARNRPLVLFFDDLHKARDDSLELVQFLVESLRDAPVVLVMLGRPELLTRCPEWIKQDSAHTKIELDPLSADESAELIRHLLAPTGDPPAELVDAGVDMAGGSPYLLEQMVQTFFDSGALVSRESGSWEARPERLDDTALPVTVEDAISARIAALAPEERELLEKASAVGTAFWMGALVALSRMSKPVPELWSGHESLVTQYHEILSALVRRGYVLPVEYSSIPGDTEYVFKHALERETLHKLASRTQMRRFHMVMAEWLEVRLPEHGEAQFAMLAEHYEESGARRKAAEYYIQAGERARSRHAPGRAVEYYQRGLDLLGAEDVTWRLTACLYYGDVLQLIGRYEHAMGTFRDMLQIAFRLDLKAKGGVAHNRIGRLYRAMGQLDQAMRHLHAGHALFESVGDVRGVASSVDDIGKVHWMRGAYEEAEQFLEHALARRSEVGDERSIAVSYNNLGLVYKDSGRISEARHAFEEALWRRREINDRQGIAQTLDELGTIDQDHGDTNRAKERYQEALSTARAIGDRMREAMVLTNLGRVHYRRGAPAEALRLLEQAEDIARSLGDWILEGRVLQALAQAQAMIQEHQVARDHIERAIERFERARGTPFLGVALRIAGEIAAMSEEVPEDARRPREAFEHSVQLFEQLGNEWELARSCDAYAWFLESVEGAESAEEARALRERAGEIRERHEAGGEPRPDRPDRLHPLR